MAAEDVVEGGGDTVVVPVDMVDSGVLVTVDPGALAVEAPGIH